METNQMGVRSFAHINLDYLNLMADGDESMKKIMLGMLLEELPAEIHKMKDMYEENNYEELGSISHKMKSTLAFVGNEVLTSTNKEIEEISKTGDNRKMMPFLLEVLENGYQKAVVELNSVYENM